MFLPAFVSLSVSNITDSLTVYGSLLIDCQHQYDMCDVWAFDGHQSLADERSPAKSPWMATGCSSIIHCFEHVFDEQSALNAHRSRHGRSQPSWHRIGLYNLWRRRRPILGS